MSYSPQQTDQEIDSLRTHCATVVESYSDLAFGRRNPLLAQFPIYRDSTSQIYLDPDNQMYRGFGMTVSPVGNTLLNAKRTLLSIETQSVLGDIGLRRYANFRKNKVGWYFGKGEPLNQQSVELLNRFAVHFGALSVRPSLFLSEHGFLALGWENSIAGYIELEFTNDEIRYSFEAIKREGSDTFEEFIKEFEEILKSK